MSSSATQDEPKRVLVTGGAGYIGSHIVISLLLTRRYLPVVIDNYTNSFPESVRGCEEIAREALGPNPTQSELATCKVDLIRAELKDAQALDEVFKKYEDKGGIWAVIHVAALKAVGGSSEFPLQYYQNNISATLSLIQIMLNHRCLNLVYSSSATVYGTPKVIPIPESSPLQPESVYGRTKSMAEEMLKDICRAERGLKTVSLRYFNPAGAHPSGKIGEDPKGKPGNLLPLLAQMAVGRHAQDGLKVFGNDYPTPDGTCVRDYLHVMDLAKGHVLSLDAIAKGTIFENRGEEGFYRAFNLGAGKGQSVLDMINAMKKASGFDYQYEIVGRRHGDVPDLTADPSMAEAELGFKATETLESMCTDLWRWQNKHPQGFHTDLANGNGKPESS